MAYVHVSREKCCGYGLCVSELETLFKIDENGYAYVEVDEIPDSIDYDIVMRAAQGCPADAIYIGSEPPPDGF